MLKNQKEIEDIIVNELGYNYIEMTKHTSSKTVIEIGDIELFVKNDITAEEFREKVAEGYINMLEHLLVSYNVELQIIENKIKAVNSVYKKYSPYIEKISTGAIDNLEPLRSLHDKINFL
jgi:hypothetical protein